MFKIIRAVATTCLLALSCQVSAAVAPISFNLVPPVQFPDSESDVTGLRMSFLIGHHARVYGLDLGVVGNSTQKAFTGIGISGIYNRNHGDTNIIGLQLAGIANINTGKTDVYGVQIALFNSNDRAESIWGFKEGGYGKIYGAQLGLYNVATDVYGLQIGLINVTENLHGLQIGLVNFHHKGLFAICPFLNFGF